ncbi:glycosyltransferase [Priestia flexa]|uniref:Glycosyltransferase n=1 Tax=Priestia flexa TaxID=86664 RepID=A0ABU4JBZ4_9BACI|nr:glycosyltransferase [Priestia flexa]MCP1189384.1 glycosyltransferase [Priestia flexa]MDW8518538.1 glycosyltransferase [Priestia flexa]QCS53892.1 glycosyltransferase family 4 protein [Priestia flexa]SIR55377.1 Glycosyltransferase involved in cell wall bisynthesis [Priestia flexa]
MKVALLTMFNGLNSTYSLVNVVAEQLRMLLDAKIETKLLVSELCPDDQREGIFKDPRVIWTKVINRLDGEIIHWRDYSHPNVNVHSTFFKETDIIAEDLQKHLQDVDICIMHDIHYQGWHLVHNVAIRKVQEKLPKLKFIAFTHSAPVNRPKHVTWPLSARYTGMPNTIYVYPTQSGIPYLAKQYNIAEGKCRVVNNSIDILKFLHPDVQDLASQTDLLSPDILIIYPARLTLGKKFEKVAAFAGAIRATTDQTVKIIFCDFESIDISSDEYKRQILSTGKKNGLETDNIIFTSDFGYKNGFPREAVMDLFTLSNLFICPSYSESFGLTVLEAASRGNFVILNEAVPALEELGSKLNAYFMRWDARNFGFDTKESYIPSERVYLEENAQKVIDLMRENVVIHSKTMSRQRYSPKWIWQNHLEPLFY